MKAGNLASGASKLALAVKQLDIKWQAAEETWRDQTARQFHKECIEPLTPKVKETLEALGRLAEVLSRASRDVSEFGGE